MTLPLIMATYMIKGVLSVIKDNSMEILWQSDKLFHANNLQRIRGELKRNSKKMIQKNVGELNCLNQNEPGYFIIIIITMGIIVIVFFSIIIIIIISIIIVINIVIIIIIIIIIINILLLFIFLNISTGLIQQNILLLISRPTSI